MANPTNNRQIPEHGILDYYNKQTYLGNSYLASSNVISLATAHTEYPIMLLSNPTSNAQAVPGTPGLQNLGLFHGVRKLSQATNVSSATTIFRYYNTAVVSNPGTAVIPGNLRPAFGNNSKALCYINPTITGNTNQVQTVTTAPDISNSLNSTYFMVYSIDPIAQVKAFYVWFNINSAGVNPNIANATGVEISAATDASADTLAGDIKTALNALSNDFTATNPGSGDTVVITNVNPGLAPVAADGNTLTFSFANTTPGVNNYGTFLSAFAVNYQEIDSSVMTILDPGQNILVTAQCDTNTTSVICELSWYEL